MNKLSKKSLSLSLSLLLGLYQAKIDCTFTRVRAEHSEEEGRLDMANNGLWNRVNFFSLVFLFIFFLLFFLLLTLSNTHRHKFNPQQQSGTQFVMTQLIQIFSLSQRSTISNPKGSLVVSSFFSLLFGFKIICEGWKTNFANCEEQIQ